MSGTVEHSIQTLVAHLKDALNGNPDAKAVSPLLDAIENGRLHFEREPWYDIPAALAGRDDAVPGELLLRACDEKGNAIPQETPISLINQTGLFALFDAAIVLSAVKQTVAQQDFPVSINISSRNAGDADSLLGLHKILTAHFAGQFDPSQIIFEFLEDDQAEEVSALAIGQMKNLGYRFAIDDLSHGAEDAARLKNLGPYADYVKIDGKTLEKAKTGETDLGDFLARIQKEAPQARIICEWVGSADEAENLHDRHPGIGLVQGRGLGHDAADFAQRLQDTSRRNPKWGPSPQ